MAGHRRYYTGSSFFWPATFTFSTITSGDIYSAGKFSLCSWVWYSSLDAGKDLPASSCFSSVPFFTCGIILHYSFTFWQIFWPGVLIFAGLMIIFRHRLDRHDWTKRGLITDDSVIDEMAVFGGGDRVVTSQSFKGGKVTTVFGGLNFDMLKAKMAPGDNHIDVFCLFGGMKLIVPEGWNVKIQGNVSFWRLQ